MTSHLQVVSVKLPPVQLRRIRGNRSQFVRQAIDEKLQRESGPRWRPKTALGRKLHKLRKQFLSQGGQVLDREGIAEEIRLRRGGVD